MLRTAPIFQDGMILQREKPVTVWGTAAPGEQVTVELQGNIAAASADENGMWNVTLAELTASESETMKVYTDHECLVYEQIAVGEVWLAGGQSNMEFHMRYEKHRQEAREHCENSRIRFFDVPEVCYDGQLEEFDYSRMGIWRKATKEDLDYFSAVGYYFQREIEQILDVPVGIIGCNWGGTTASVWMNPETVERVGKPWMRLYEQRCEGRDMDEYWAGQHNNPMNNRSDFFSDRFGEMVMPRTLSEEELRQLAADFPDYFAQMPVDMMPPQTIPGCLYEHMVKTISPYAIRGVLWYQGESDDDIPGMNVLYKDMLTGLIEDWRMLWKEKLPFLIVQLPGFDKWLLNTQENHYPVIRQCQEETANTVEGVHMCSISDVGEERDIHPKDKKTVGKRLSLLARHYVYGEDILCDAPVAKEVVRDNSRITITFANAGNGLHIAGEDISALNVTAVGDKTILESQDNEMAFTAKTEGKRLLITLQENTDKKVKIAFARTSWYLVNLYNEAGIPAIPFEFVC